MDMLLCATYIDLLLLYEFALRFACDIIDKLM